MKKLNTYILEKFKISNEYNPTPLSYEKGEKILIIEYGYTDKSDTGGLRLYLGTFEKSTDAEIWYNHPIKGDLKEEGFINDKNYYETVIKENDTTIKEVFLPTEPALNILKEFMDATVGNTKNILKKYFDSSDKEVSTQKCVLISFYSDIKKIIDKLDN